MPLFTKRFELKTIPPRLSRCNNGCPMVAEDLDDYKQISLNLGSKELRFADGIWIHASRKSDVDDVVRVTRRLKALEEEKNMCDIKIEVLLDLLAEHATEINMLKANKID